MSQAETTTGTQYLTCSMGGDLFALEIRHVREVLDFPAITRIPRTPEFMRGVINLRGTVVPVVDLGSAFGSGKTERSVHSCAVILEFLLRGEPIVLGALADSVQQVVELDYSQIEPAPRIGMKLRGDFVRGIGKQDDRFLIILDLEKVFSGELLGLPGSSGAEHALVTA